MNIVEYHKILLEMLKDFAEMCEQNHLTYFLVGGSALGAVREKGFIEWDDDVDIGLPRKDYDKLKEIIPRQFGEKYELRYRQNACIYHFLKKDMKIDFSKVNVSGKGRIGYPFIDLFPIDGAPNNRFLRWAHMTKILFYTYLHKFACIQMCVEHEGRSRLGNGVIRGAHILHTEKFLSARKSAKLWMRAAEKYSYAHSKWCVIAFGSYKYHDIFPKSWVGKGKKVPFEDTQFRIFSYCEGYLRQLYGEDYMIPHKRAH
ncbi:MAG: LicD family protein [Dorea sp.]|jgi:lipopolysaccharide cholinephosphotransferase|nr:LicD family protein [Dorea sp.]